MPSALLVLWEGTLSVIGVFTPQRPVMMKFDVFIAVRPTKQLSKQCFRRHDAAMTSGDHAFHLGLCSPDLKGRYKKMKKDKVYHHNMMEIIKYYIGICCICFVQETHWKSILLTQPTVTTVISLAFNIQLSTVTKIKLTHSYMYIYIYLGHHWLREWRVAFRCQATI